MTDHSDTLKLGVWQGAGQPGDVAANLDEVERLMGRAADRGVDLLVCPEGFLTGYYATDDVDALASQVDASKLERLEALSRHHGIALVLGSHQSGRSTVHNAALVIHPELGRIGPYRKRMLFGDWEKRSFVPGQSPLLFRWKGWCVGVLICFDIEFPEMTREIALMGADLIVTPTALMAPYHTVATRIVPARAMENGVFVAYANRIGRERELEYVGLSCIVSPDGEDMARASGEGAELLFAEVSLAQKAHVRAEIDYLAELSLRKS